MKLEGKCYDDFEEWLEWDDNKDKPKPEVKLIPFGDSKDSWLNMRCLEHFSQLTDSMKYGVIVDFSETVENITQYKMVESEQSYITGGHLRPAARVFSVEKFNKRYNQNKKL